MNNGWDCLNPSTNVLGFFILFLIIKLECTIFVLLFVFSIVPVTTYTFINVQVVILFMECLKIYYPNCNLFNLKSYNIIRKGLVFTRHPEGVLHPTSMYAYLELL